VEAATKKFLPGSGEKVPVEAIEVAEAKEAGGPP
jgi:hypothetical protein